MSRIACSTISYTHTMTTDNITSTLNLVVTQAISWAKAHADDPDTGRAVTLPAVGVAPIETLVSTLGIDPGAYARPLVEEVLGGVLTHHTLTPVLVAEYDYAVDDPTHPVRVLDIATMHHPRLNGTITEIADMLRTHHNAAPHTPASIYADLGAVKATRTDNTTLFTTPHSLHPIHGDVVGIQHLCTTVEHTEAIIGNTVNLSVNVCDDLSDADAIVRAQHPEVTRTQPGWTLLGQYCAALIFDDLADTLRHKLRSRMTHPEGVDNTQH